MSSTNLGICGLCRLCCASSVFCKHCFSHLAFAQSFGGRFLCSWESLILPSASLLQLLGLRVWLFFSSCWSLKLVGQAPSLDFSLAQWNVLVVMSQQAGLAQRRQKLCNICRACRRSSCVPRSSRRGEGLKTAHTKYLPGFSIHKSEQENVPGHFQLPGKGWQGQKKWSHNFPKQRIIQTLCFSSKGSWGEQLKIFYFPVLLDLAQWDINSCMEIFVPSVSCSQGHPNHRTAPGIDLCLKVKSKWKCDSL